MFRSFLLLLELHGRAVESRAGSSRASPSSELEGVPGPTDALPRMSAAHRAASIGRQLRTSMSPPTSCDDPPRRAERSRSIVPRRAIGGVSQMICPHPLMPE